MKRYILWDNDGVLVDTEFWYFEATRRALADLGVTLDKETYLRRMAQGLTSWDLAAAAGIDGERIATKRQQRDAWYEEYLLHETIDIPGIEQMLEQLSKTHRMAIVTTSTRAHFELIHRNRRLAQYMDFVLTREDYVASKPDPEPYLLALKKFGAGAADCLVVEDSQRGLQAAIAAGIDCAVVYNEFTAGHDFSGARHRVHSIDELPGIFDEHG